MVRIVIKNSHWTTEKTAAEFLAGAAYLHLVRRLRHAQNLTFILTWILQSLKFSQFSLTYDVQAPFSKPQFMML